MVLVDGPIGQLARVEGVGRERETLRLLQLRSAEDGAHARLLGVAAVQAHSLDADGPRALLGRARRRVQAAAARAHHADVALVIDVYKRQVQTPRKASVWMGLITAAS